MNLIQCKSTDLLVDHSLRWLRETLEDFDFSTIFIPAGKTPIPLYQKINRMQEDWLKKLKFVQIDDVISSAGKGMFKSFLGSHLTSFKDQIHFIEYGEVKAQAAILGLGLNGHVAFHEPHLPPEFCFGEVELSPDSCKTLGIPNGSKGCTHGLGNILGTGRILLIVTGEHKENILKRTLARDPSVPARHLINHRDLTIVTDINIEKADP